MHAGHVGVQCITPRVCAGVRRCAKVCELSRRSSRGGAWGGFWKLQVAQLLYRNVKRFRGGLVFEARRLLYHSTLGLRGMKKKKKSHVCEMGSKAFSDSGSLATGVPRS